MATGTLALTSDVFSRRDYWVIFGSYAATALLYFALGLLGVCLFPACYLGRALLSVGSVSGTYALSAVGIYGPSFDIRIHALTEAFLPAAVACLALVFPRERPALLAPLGTFALPLSSALALPYQLLLSQPAVHSTLRAACEAYLGFVGLFFAGSVIVHYRSSRCSKTNSTTPLLHAATAAVILGHGVPAVTPSSQA